MSQDFSKINLCKEWNWHFYYTYVIFNYYRIQYVLCMNQLTCMCFDPIFRTITFKRWESFSAKSLPNLLSMRICELYVHRFSKLFYLLMLGLLCIPTKSFVNPLWLLSWINFSFIPKIKKALTHKPNSIVPSSMSQFTIQILSIGNLVL